MQSCRHRYSQSWTSTIYVQMPPLERQWQWDRMSICHWVDEMLRVVHSEVGMQVPQPAIHYNLSSSPYGSYWWVPMSFVIRLYRVLPSLLLLGYTSIYTLLELVYFTSSIQLPSTIQQCWNLLWPILHSTIWTICPGSLILPLLVYLSSIDSLQTSQE